MLSAPQDVWPEVLRCISRFELVSQSGPSDMAIFSQPGPEAASPSGLAKMRRGFFGSAKPTKQDGAHLLDTSVTGKSLLVANSRSQSWTAFVVHFFSKWNEM